MSIEQHAPARPRTKAPFRSIACGIDGSRADAEVARQAAILAGPGTPLELLSIAWESGMGISAQATLTYAHADAALRKAAAIVRKAGGQPHERRVNAPDAGAALVELGAAHDLLVLGTDRHGRIGGIATGRAGTLALHRADCAVMIVRDARGAAPFPRRILLADDGQACSEQAAAIVAALAGTFGAGVDVAVPMALGPDARRRLEEHGDAIVRAGAPEPVMVDVRGRAHGAILRLAHDLGSSLIVLGSRRLHGPLALASVSERVAHAAPCSVLVARAAR